MKVAWTEHAYAQLDEAMEFIARDRPDTALAWLERILQAADDLRELPERGRIVPEAERNDIRELLISPYRLVYRVDSDAVTITMVLHERQDVTGDDVT